MTRPTRLSKAALAGIRARLDEGKPVRRSLPGWGRLHVDRSLPFLVVYRRPLGKKDPGADKLVLGSASYLLADTDEQGEANTARIIRQVAESQLGSFGAFLVIEVWAGKPVPADEMPARPEYRIIRRKNSGLSRTLGELATSLRDHPIGRQAPKAAIEDRNKVAPPRMSPLSEALSGLEGDVRVIGLEVRPVFRDRSGTPYPLLLRQCAHAVSISLDRAFYRFTLTRTTARPASYHALGRRAVVNAVFEVDRALADIDEAFDVLLQVTPINTAQAWNEFRRSRYERAPRFVYRPLPFDPGRMKHRLWGIRPDRVEDPTLMYLFRDAQLSIDRRLTLLSEIEKPTFVHTSRQLHGDVDETLLAEASEMLASLPRRRRSRRTPRINAEEFCGLASAEILSYREETPEFGTMPVVRDDIYAGLMVSRGAVLIGAEASIPASRADALIQHEIGTHVVTHHNGLLQRLHLLRVGLPGYDELQEGLAVLAEHLVGGIDSERMRVLAVRVLAARSVLEGASFVETFRLVTGHGFSKQSAFTVTTRVHRGGGLVKDAMYLRGLASLIGYLSGGGDVERLFIGKFATEHLPVVSELLEREVLARPAVLPRYLRRQDASERLARIASGMRPRDLVEG